MMKSLSLAVLGLLLALPATLGAQEPVPFLTDISAPGDRDCAEAEQPDPLPPLTQLGDSTALARAISDVSTEALERRYALYALHYGDGGALEWIAQLRTNLPDEAREPVADSLRAHLRPEQPEEHWTVRLAVGFGQRPGFVVGRSEVCPPEMLEGIRKRGRIVSTDRHPDELRTTRPYRFRVKVSTAGRALSVRMRQGSGSRFVDDLGREAAKEARYLPELHDGVPVVGWYDFEAPVW